jgi:hypothetical protein
MKMLLHKLKLIENDPCSFCDSERGTISHIFYDCDHTNVFWQILYNGTVVLKMLTRLQNELYHLEMFK